MCWISQHLPNVYKRVSPSQRLERWLTHFAYPSPNVYIGWKSANQTWPTYNIFGPLYISGMAAATNFIFGVYIHYNEYYRKMQYQETKGAWRMIRFWDPSTSLDTLKLQPSNLVCRLKTSVQNAKSGDKAGDEGGLGHVSYV